MKSKYRIFSILLAMALLLALLPMSAVPASAANADALVLQINAISGLYATLTGLNEVTVTGEAMDVKTKIDFNTDPSVTVYWQADLSTSTLATTNYLLTLSGSGTFEMSSCTISNLKGTAGVINITGAGAIVTVGDEANVLSDRDGNAIHIEANNVILNINTGGTVAGRSGSTKAVIQDSGNHTGLSINVNGGIVHSEVGGYAISDGPSTGVSNNNTIITISNGGTVLAGSSTAIRSSGTGSMVEIHDGTVSSSGTSSLSPTINMVGGNGNNVIISGGTVENTGIGTTSNTLNTSYAVQTTGNVVVSDGIVSTIAGRAINLVGMNSCAIIIGGIVKATNTDVAFGTAICTATSTPANVANASVIVTGGTVSATGGYAIRITGANSKVSVSGGSVSSTSGNAINADNTATNSEIIISGGSVLSISGYAINNGGTNSATIISDTDDGLGRSGGSGGQVAVLKEGQAIYSRGTVEVNGGFVFAYGTDPSKAVTALSGYTLPGTSGMVGVWDQAANVTLYEHETDDDLTPIIGGPNDFKWFLDTSIGSGIYYENGATKGFFLLNSVKVVKDYGLIFDSSTGDMHVNLDGSGIPNSTNHLFDIGQNTSWTGIPGKLELNGFHWKTSEPVALTVYGGDATINFTGDNRFESVSDTGTSIGMKSDNHNIVVEGDGSLAVVGSEIDPSYGIDLGTGNLSLKSGNITVQGSQSAVECGGIDQFPAYCRWTSDAATGIYPDDIYNYSNADKYFAVEMMETIGFSAISVSGVRNMADSTGILLTFDHPVSGLSANDISLLHTNGTVTKGALTGSGKNWIIALENVSNEGMVNVKVSHFGSFYVDEPNGKDVMVYKALLYDLDVTAGAGGTISGDTSGKYLKDTPIELEAIADSGCYFTGWTANGVTLSDALANPLTFDMPANAVALTANFTPFTKIAFSAEQIGGTSGTIDSTGIKIVFDSPLAGLTRSDISVANGTGAVVTGGFSGSGSTYTVALTEVLSEGYVTVSVANFGTYAITTPPQIVAVYKYKHTPVPAVPPSAPGNFNATPGDAQVTLNWTTPSNGGSAITKYQISYGTAEGYSPNWTDIPGSGANTKTYTVSGLTNGVKYAFEIRAVNAVGEGASSGKKTAIPENENSGDGENGGGSGGSGGGNMGGGGYPSHMDAAVVPYKASYYINSGEDVIVALYGGGHDLLGISNGGYTLIEGKDYTADGNIYTIKAKYLDTFPFGKQTFVFNMSGGENPVLTVSVKYGTLNPITPGMPYNPFIDVFGTDWFIDAVIYVYHNDLMTGTSTNPMLFSPNMPLSRAMVVTILYRLENEPHISGLSNIFEDVAEGAWYTDAVMWASANELVFGYGDGRFGPEDDITREQLAAILMRYMVYKGTNIAVPANWIFFSDEADISGYAKNAVQTFYKLGIIKGIGTDEENRAIIDPKNSATRAQTAAIFHRFLLSIQEFMF